jgi:predicted SAM-dependent methyltransferase
LQTESIRAETNLTSDASSQIKTTNLEQKARLLRLHIGCGPRILKGWVNIDLVFEPWENYMQYYTDEFYGPDVRGVKDDFLALDVTKAPLPFADNSVDVIFNEDFIEHLDQRQIMLFLAETFRVLKPGGIHRVTTPDLMWIMQNHSDFSKGYPGVYQEAWHKWCHKDHLTRRYLEDVAALVGYQVVFQRRDVSLSPDIPREYRPDRNDAPDEGHIFADLVKVDVTEPGLGKFYEKSLACPESPETIIQQLKRKGLLHTNQPLRLHLGCGEQYLEGYINIDYPQSEHNVVQVKADVCADIKILDFPPDSVDEIRLHHVFEHFSRVTALAMLIKWHRWLKIGGRLHIETPDLMGSAKALVSNTSWKTRMGVVRHLAGDQAANWGYHIDHWFPERFEHTLKALGFEEIQTLSSSWPKEPYLSNVKVVAVKSKYFSPQEQLKAAEQLLWESTVAPEEKPTWEVWKNQLRTALAGDFAPRLSNVQEDSHFAKNCKIGSTPDVSSIYQAPAILSRNNAQLPLDEITDFNQRSRDRWVRAKAKTIAAGSRVLDVGAGTCPYRSLFAHCDYKAHDFKKYTGTKLGNTTQYGKLDYESDIISIPVPDGSFDVILCTEVLEHVPEPVKAVREMARIIRTGGRLLMTAPLGSGLHQLPYHYYGGYTPEWYKHFFPKFALQVKEITQNGGFFKLLAQECARVKWTLPQHRHLHGSSVEFIRHLFGQWLPRYLFALEERCFIDQFTVGYHVEAVKN